MVYIKMDYAKVLEYHIAKKADVTIVTSTVDERRPKQIWCDKDKMQTEELLILRRSRSQQTVIRFRQEYMS